MKDIILPDYYEPVLYDVVGHIPATDKTPDIYYSGDPSSEKVAALTFLTMWFLDPAIQSLITERASAVICGLSPASGGGKLETAFAKATDVTNIGNHIVTYDFGKRANEYSGTCHYPLWEDGVLVRKGHIAIYATSVNEDERNGYTARWKEKSKYSSPKYLIPPEDHLYKSIHYRSENKFGVHMILDAFLLPDDERNAYLANVLKNEFSDIDSLFDMVPKRVTHEVAHLLEYGNDLEATPDIIKEVAENIPRRNSMLRYYRPPLEAVAEVVGIALIQQVKRNAGLDFGIPTTMLDKFIPYTYDHVEQKINEISGMPEPQ